MIDVDSITGTMRFADSVQMLCHNVVHVLFIL